MVFFKYYQSSPTNNLLSGRVIRDGPSSVGVENYQGLDKHDSAQKSEKFWKLQSTSIRRGLAVTTPKKIIRPQPTSLAVENCNTVLPRPGMLAEETPQI
jgi:hypothetical protein